MINGIIKELEKLIKENDKLYKRVGDDSFVNGRTDGLEDAIEIVKKYENDGWILCSEKLPEEPNIYLVTIRPEFAKSGKYDYVSGKSYQDGFLTRHNERNIIAWQPLPQPYKGE